MTKPAIRNKWVNYMDLAGDPKLKRHLPTTLKMTWESFWQLMDRYHSVMLKPCEGHSGYGVIQVRTRTQDVYEIHAENAISTGKGREHTYYALQSKMLAQAYIVQRRVSLATIRKQSFDLRVMVQRKENKPWVVTGMFAKVADRGYVITNVARAILPVSKAVRKSSIPLRNQQDLIKKVRRVSIRSAQRLGRIYPSQRIVGLDIGLDRKGNITIIEANFKPRISPFRMMKDKTMYRKIMAYQK